LSIEVTFLLVVFGTGGGAASSCAGFVAELAETQGQDVALVYGVDGGRHASKSDSRPPAVSRVSAA